MRGLLERKRLLVIAGAAVLAASSLVGCTDEGDSNGDGSASTTSSVAEASGTTAVTGLTAPSTFTTTQPPGGSQAGSTPTSEGGTATVGGKSREDYEKEITELQKKLEQTPDDLSLLLRLAVAQYQTNREDEAAKTYQKMLALDDQALTRNNYGNVLRDLGRTDAAKEQYQKAIEMKPDLAVAYVNLANVIAKEGKKDEALEVLDQGIAKTAGDDKTRLQDIKKALEEA